VRGEGFDVVPVAGEDGATRFGERHDEGIDGRASASPSSELSRSPSDDVGDEGFDDPRRERPVRVGVAADVAVQRFGELSPSA